jgi:hypothetical protein
MCAAHVLLSTDHLWAALQAVSDPMHTVDLGIWTHLLTCIACTYDNVVSQHRILPPKRVSSIWNKLEQRCKDLNPYETMLRVNKFKARFLHFRLMEKKDPNARKRKLEAWEQHLLMLVSL